jgi:hypothetical protein
VTLLYRWAAGEPANFARRTLWAMHRENAEELARFEGEGRLPAGGRLYEVDATMDYEEFAVAVGRGRRTSRGFWSG